MINVPNYSSSPILINLHWHKMAPMIYQSWLQLSKCLTFFLHYRKAKSNLRTITAFRGETNLESRKLRCVMFAYLLSSVTWMQRDIVAHCYCLHFAPTGVPQNRSSHSDSIYRFSGRSIALGVSRQWGSSLRELHDALQRAACRGSPPPPHTQPDCGL